ncbi:hypothetical protein JN531_017220 (plasmid) [Flagellatimonas centrodinii]|uniref:hypothetical protein n=1 Tax=Flagellatimonas centrodinii TaxID=2806210 RepID=UPI001FEEC3BE|nr:hypothetical protein [Flagellatimonas centrodinii]ULQ48374.1 hypothetical protein JN531_017220 [Flagellatimonas centrodinii]
MAAAFGYRVTADGIKIDEYNNVSLSIAEDGGGNAISVPTLLARKVSCELSTLVVSHGCLLESVNGGVQVCLTGNSPRGLDQLVATVEDDIRRDINAIQDSMTGLLHDLDYCRASGEYEGSFQTARYRVSWDLNADDTEWEDASVLYPLAEAVDIVKNLRSRWGTMTVRVESRDSISDPIWREVAIARQPYLGIDRSEHRAARRALLVDALEEAGLSSRNRHSERRAIGPGASPALPQKASAPSVEPYYPQFATICPEILGELRLLQVDIQGRNPAYCQIQLVANPAMGGCFVHCEDELTGCCLDRQGPFRALRDAEQAYFAAMEAFTAKGFGVLTDPWDYDITEGLSDVLRTIEGGQAERERAIAAREGTVEMRAYLAHRNSQALFA